MSEEFHDHPKVDTLGEQQARSCMSKIVKSRLGGYFGGSQQTLEIAMKRNRL